MLLRFGFLGQGVTGCRRAVRRQSTASTRSLKTVKPGHPVVADTSMSKFISIGEVAWGRRSICPPSEIIDMSAFLVGYKVRGLN
jgi:hypothetical protein